MTALAAQAPLAAGVMAGDGHAMAELYPAFWVGHA